TLFTQRRAVVVRARSVARAAVIEVGGNVDLTTVFDQGIAVLKPVRASRDLAASAEALRVGIVEIARAVARAAVIEVGGESDLAAVGGALVAVRRTCAADELTGAGVFGTRDTFTHGALWSRAVRAVVASLAHVAAGAVFATAVDVGLVPVLDLVAAARHL